MPRCRWVPVTTPVDARVGPVYLRLFPYEQVDTAPDDYDERPWAWGALCRVTFRFGSRVTSKRITTRYVYWGPRAFAQQERPSAAALVEGRETVLANLRLFIKQHGVETGEFEIIEEERGA